MRWDKPEDATDWLARFIVIISLTAVIGGVVVGGVMYLLFDAGVWSLAGAVAIIFLLLTWIGFKAEGEEEPEVETWAQRRPAGTTDWFKFTGQALIAWFGLGVIVNKLILGLLLDASDTAQAIAALVLLPLAFVLEFYLGESKAAESAGESLAEHPDERPGLVDA